jgi:hypothetical protein
VRQAIPLSKKLKDSNSSRRLAPPPPPSHTICNVLLIPVLTIVAAVMASKLVAMSKFFVFMEHEPLTKHPIFTVIVIGLMPGLYLQDLSLVQYTTDKKAIECKIPWSAPDSVPKAEWGFVEGVDEIKGETAAENKSVRVMIYDGSDTKEHKLQAIFSLSRRDIQSIKLVVMARMEGPESYTSTDYTISMTPPPPPGLLPPMMMMPPPPPPPPSGSH